MKDIVDAEKIIGGDGILFTSRLCFVCQKINGWMYDLYQIEGIILKK